MQQAYKLSCFIFHRDLRLHDNKGLFQALKRSGLVMPCFIFDPQQIGEGNMYRSMNALQFMIESLKELDESLKKRRAKLYIFYGDTIAIVDKLIEKHKVDAVFCNKDYTPFAKNRDTILKKHCEKKSVGFYEHADVLLHEPEVVLKANGSPCTQFSAFYNNVSKKSIESPFRQLSNNYFTEHSFDEKDKDKVYRLVLANSNDSLAIKGGRAGALAILEHLIKFKNYEKDRNLASKSTTHLSAHLKFGTVSIREVYAAIWKCLGSSHPLVRQLYWRDFFTHIAYHFPYYVFGGAFKKQYAKIAWIFNEKQYYAWCHGNTGFPLVDAGMRELTQTGFMHNRVRMVVASFLIKDLHIDWRIGERFFAQHLVDYDPCVNNGNWQWVASTGCDSQPYFRIFNPWLQQKKIDPDVTYIKQWIPELRNVSASIIHNWYKHSSNITSYPNPIVDHAQQAVKARILFKKIH